MMDGRNSAGRKISLLNCSGDVAAALPNSAIRLCSSQGQHRRQQNSHGTSSSSYQLPPLLAHTHSRTSSSSCTSTPCLSPQTPQLVRSDSSDSRTTFASPSPLTPSYNSFESSTTSHLRHQPAQKQPSSHHLHHHHQQQQQPHQQGAQQYYFPTSRPQPAKMDDPTISLYPPIPDVSGSLTSAYPMPPQLNPQMPLHADLDPVAMSMYRSSNSPASEPSLVSSVSAASTTNTSTTATNAKPTPKKNQYPCPLAKQFNCRDYFTTSGHAARHAKKHTGKKDAFCPECNKAFTRKDNMEQHRRTHQSGRNSGRTSDDKVKKTTKPSTKKTTSIKADVPVIEAAIEQQLVTQQQQEQQQQQHAVQHQQQEVAAAQMQAAVDAQVNAAQIQQHVQQQAALEAAMMPSGAGPYFLNTLDSGPIPALPLPAMTDMSVRPPLFRSNLTSSIDYIPPLLTGLDLDTLNYSYPSPGLSNGLNSLALAASERNRLSEDKSDLSSSHQADSSSDSGPSPPQDQETPMGGTPSTESP